MYSACYCCQILGKLEFRLVEAELFHADRQT